MSEGFLPPTPQEHIEYLEAEVQRLTADVRRLREENTQHVGVAAKVILENQRLREEIGRLDRQVSGVQALGRLNAKLTEERDALAEALLVLRNWDGTGDRQALKDQAEAALARAGRTT